MYNKHVPVLQSHINKQSELTMNVGFLNTNE